MVAPGVITVSVRAVALSLAVDGGSPPTEFRVFQAGSNETVKGTFLFDAAAAEAVLAEYLAHGVDLPIDYDHAMLGGSAADPALAGRAAGWFALEVRNGELWAVNVRWTEPAAEALRRKEWRFISPAFHTDSKGRVLSLINVAITNLPATRRLDPLMAASVTASGDQSMTLEEMMKVAEALGLGADATLDDFLAKIGAMKGESAPEEMPVEEAPPVEMSSDEEEKAAEVMAATSRLKRITCKGNIASAVDEVELWRLSHLKLEEETKRLAKERAALELSKRKENAITLTKLGAETPHTTGLASGKLCKRLLEEPLDEQNSRVAALLSARGGKLPNAAQPPSEGSTSNVFETKYGRYEMSEREMQLCSAKKIDPAKYAETRAAIRARKQGT